MANPNLMNEKQLINVVKYRKLWFILSALIIIPCLVAIIYSIITYDNHSPLNLGIDFRGGTILQYEVDHKATADDLKTIRVELNKAGIENPVIQSIAGLGEDDKNFLSVKTKFIDENSTDAEKITLAIQKDYKDAKLVQTTSVGPTLGAEVLQKSLIALTIAFIGIVIYVTVRFQLDYAVAGLIALFHDVIIVIGAFSILGIFYNIQVDSLFITALLTVIGFSIHDTIVIYDRIRENNRFLAKKYSFNEIVNASVNQTLARSINTSLTTLFTLFALYFFGGATTKDFVLAMIIGMFVGSYSSIFIAGALLTLWEDMRAKKAINE
jgi:preprotein translocase subunit SecF